MTQEKQKRSNVGESETPRVVDYEELRRLRERHLERLAEIPDRKEPESGELADISLEEEFED